MPQPGAPQRWAISGQSRRSKRPLGRIEQALTDSNEAIRLDPNLARAYLARGAVRIKGGQPDMALADLNKAVRLDPQLGLAYAQRALAFSAKGEIDRAIADFDQAIRLSPTLALAYLNRGVAYERQGRLDKALNDYLETSRLAPGHASAHYDLGNVHRDMKQFDRAIAAYSEAIRLDPLAKLPESEQRSLAEAAKRGEQVSAVTALSACDPEAPKAPTLDPLAWSMSTPQERVAFVTAVGRREIENVFDASDPCYALTRSYALEQAWNAATAPERLAFAGEHHDEIKTLGWQQKWR